MNAPIPQETMSAPARQGEASLSAQWSAMREAGAAIGQLAGVAPQRPEAAERNFAATIRDAGEWRLALARDGLADMAAMLQPGLSALLAVKARGHDASAPARALWEEYCARHDALLALAPQEGAMGPRRSA
ncbi:hypothetical protein [Pelagerythrobacter marinus]|uniref:hypothetical protein n=1 Tax=Pelagerythrobacter marinus TaxID=538382 RepID=UPI002AC8D874|nr:hypothetical protein [Pelagerythrobacter marinus]WPZ06544.1 hypothetical protein T8T98_14200 [Pelagerythrobacter marinus]